MKFFLDSLFISLVVLCVLLLYRLIKQRVIHKGKQLKGHAVLLPIEFSKENQRELLLKYELPAESEVIISLYDEHDHLIETLINKSQKAGSYFLKEQLPHNGNTFFLKFASDNTKVTRKLIVS